MNGNKDAVLAHKKHCHSLEIDTTQMVYPIKVSFSSECYCFLNFMNAKTDSLISYQKQQHSLETAMEMVKFHNES